MEILRYTAFSVDRDGGNPAGVVLDATGLNAEDMLGIAAKVGFSETAFLRPQGGHRFEVRYFSPLAEVPFCGHATIATAVAYAARHGAGILRLDTQAGHVSVTTSIPEDGTPTATLVTVPTRSGPLAEDDLAAVLSALRWAPDDLDPALPPRVGFAGAWHPIIAAASRARLADLDYDFTELGHLMAGRDWTTIQLVWREATLTFHARNPFPPGGVVEDPATGAAAAALGGYLRELKLITPPVTITIHQGVDLGRPSLLTVGVGADPGSGVAVTGTAVPLDD